MTRILAVFQISNFKPTAAAFLEYSSWISIENGEDFLESNKISFLG